MKKWFSLLISDNTPTWLRLEKLLKKQGPNVAGRYWFGFISITIMSSKNKSILKHTKESCCVCIIDWTRLNLGCCTRDAYELQLALDFPSLFGIDCRVVQTGSSS